MITGGLPTDFEKAIDLVVEKHAPNPSTRQLFENGERSVLKEKYGLDFDQYSQHWCFRSAKPSELFVEHEYPEHYPSRTDNIESFLLSMMIDVRNAINNSYAFKKECQSYSKFLAAPLFKYIRGNGPFIIDELPLNSLDISVSVKCFDWVGEHMVSYDIYGNTQDRNHTEDCFLTIPFTELFSKKKLVKRIYEDLSPVFESRRNMIDIDNITLSISEMTLDISEVNRNAFDLFFQEHGRFFLKRHASYKKDREVLTTRKTVSYKGMIIRNPKAIQILRFVYLLMISNWHLGQVGTFIADLFSNKHPEIAELEEDEIKAIRWVMNHLGSEKKAIKEREVYWETFRSAPQSNLGYAGDRDNFIKHVLSLQCFDNEFGQVLVSRAFKEE